MSSKRATSAVLGRGVSPSIHHFGLPAARLGFREVMPSVRLLLRAISFVAGHLLSPSLCVSTPYCGTRNEAGSSLASPSILLMNADDVPPQQACAHGNSQIMDHHRVPMPTLPCRQISHVGCYLSFPVNSVGLRERPAASAMDPPCVLQALCCKQRGAQVRWAY